MENEVLVTDDREVANIFNEYFISITEVLGIQEPKDILMPIEGLHDPIEVAIKKFSSHPSIELIYKNKKSSNEFRFKMVVRERVATEIQKLKLNKYLQMRYKSSSMIVSLMELFPQNLR